MVRKIGVSLPDELYEWAAGQVEQGRTESVSGLVAEGLGVIRAHAELEALVADLEAQVGEVDEETEARVQQALSAADEAYRSRLTRKAGHAA